MNFHFPEWATRAPFVLKFDPKATAACFRFCLLLFDEKDPTQIVITGYGETPAAAAKDANSKLRRPRS
jgi:hypothetical protein